MIDVATETLLSFVQAAREPTFRDPKTGTPCHVSAVYRYATQGARAVNGARIRLETVKTPRGLMTSREAIQRLVERLTNPDAGGECAAPARAARQREAARVDAELDAAGIR